MMPESSVMRKITELTLISRAGMKSFLKSIVVASTAIFAVVGCQKEASSPEGTRKVHFVLHATAPETKTGIMYDNGTYDTYWNKGDELGVIFTLPTEKRDLKPAATFKNTEESGNLAIFEGDVTLADGEGVTFYSFYPASSAAKYYVNDDVVTIGLDVPTSQTPTYDAAFGYSFDPKADILIAKPAICTVDSGFAMNDVDMYFARLSSVFRIELNAESTAKFYGEMVKSFKIETSAGDIAGRIAVNPLTGVYSKTISKSGSTAITATYDTSNVPVYIGYDSINNVFLSVAPVTIAKGSTITVTIETVTAAGAKGHTLSKTFTTTSDIVFESSKPTVLKLSLTDENILEDNTISKITKAGTYSVSGVTVMAVYGQNIIVSDATGSIWVYAAKDHGYVVGDVLDINGIVEFYNQVFEFKTPTITKTGTATVTYPTAVEYNAAKMADYATNSVIEYGHALGLANSSARTVTLAGGQVLNVYGDLSSVDGKGVDIYGYAFGYKDGKVNFLYTATPVVNEAYPVLSTTPENGETFTWKAGEYGSEKAQTITIAINGKATGYTVSAAGTDWTVTDDGNGTLTVYPNEANTSTTADKTLDITVTHKNNAALTSTIHLVQAFSGAAEPKVLIIDAAQLTSYTTSKTATTEDVTKTYSGVDIVFSKGAYQCDVYSKSKNKFSDEKTILIGKAGAYIYNKTAIPGKITKFEIYSNKGASTNVEVGVNFSATAITAYSADAANTFTTKLKNDDSVYDCSEKLPENAKFFWYQITSKHNSQVQFRITYVEE